MANCRCDWQSCCQLPDRTDEYTEYTRYSLRDFVPGLAGEHRIGNIQSKLTRSVTVDGACVLGYPPSWS